MINLAKPDYSNTPASPLRPRLAYRPADPASAPVISIVTPFFNAGAIFHETVESVLRQSLQQWEWIIVNDGSDDACSLKILDEFRCKDPRIRVVEHERQEGPGAARNTGVRAARAEFVFHLEADHLIEPVALEQMAWFLQARPGLAFTTGFSVEVGCRNKLWDQGFHSGEKILEENLVKGACLVRKSVHHAIGGYETGNRSGGETWDFWLKAAAKGFCGGTIPEFLDWFHSSGSGGEQRDTAEKTSARLKQRYPALWQGKFPKKTAVRPAYSSTVAETPPFANRLTKDRPRLLLIVPKYELGGADKFNLDLIRQLQREHSYEITVAGLDRSKNPWLHEFQSLTPDVFVLHNFLPVDDFPLFLRYLIESRQPDTVCISESILGYQLLPYLRAHFPRIPFVDYLHIELEEWMRGGYPRCSLELQSQLACTVVSSQHLKDWMVTRGANAAAIKVCYTNIDCEKWRRDRFDVPSLAQKWKVDLAKPVILYPARICDQKQPRMFAEVMRQLAKKNPAFTALVAGDGPDLPWLEEFVQEERLKQIRFLGAVSNDAVAELLALSRICFLPSRWEGIALALFEAMAMETVPVGAVVGGHSELVTPDCGILVKRGPNEAADYTKALATLLASPSECLRMAQNARRRVIEHFPIAELGRNMDALFRNAAIAVLENSPKDVMSLELAAIYAREVVRHAREVAQQIRDREELIPFMTHSVLWQACLRAGRALAKSAQTKLALAQFEEGLRFAIASRIPAVELGARLEIGKALIPLDSQRARSVLSDALELADGAGDPAMRTQISQALGSLNGERPSRPDQRAPLVSVVIPCYKQAHFLPEAVESVVAQTFSDWEILIVNDGSPDNTGEVAKQLIAKHPGKQIRLVEKSNGGLPGARNAGIRAARGKYLLPLDADDKIKPTLLAKLVSILDNRPKVGFAYSHIQHFGEIDTEFPLPDFDRATLITKDNIACVCALVRRSAWEQAGGYNEAMREGYEDWDFWIGCVEHGWDGYCLHEPLFLYRKSGRTMLSDANQKRERLIAQIVQNHPKLYSEATRQSAKDLLARHAATKAAEVAKPAASSTDAAASLSVQSGQPRLRITYLISSILGVTGGNQTLLRQAEEMRRRGHEVTIVTCTAKPEWFQGQVRVIQAPAGKPMAPSVPPSDVVIATYFTNAHELPAIKAPVKVYYAQGDQFVFADATMADTPQNRRLRELSRASYLLPGIRFVPNSRNLADAVQKLCGRRHDAILPVCTDQTIFRPLQRSLPGSKFRLLIVGPDTRGTEAEPLLFKGIQDIHDALQILARQYPHFTAVRMSAGAPDIFARFPCEFYIAPGDEMKTVLFGTSHIHIYASHYDSCPRPPQEAMAAGCAVVCTATGGAMEYCRDGENALLVPVKSPQAIADAVERLIRDPALREKLVQGGLATAREYPREREWNEWEAILFRFIHEAAKPAAAAAVAAKPVKPAAPIKLPPCALAGHLGEARDLLKKKNLQAAWESACAAIQARPFHPEACLFLGKTAQAAGDFDSARRCGQYASRLAPHWKPAKQFLKAAPRGNGKPGRLILPLAITEKADSAPRLSVCLIVKNEEQFLEQCLQSVRDIAWQIVVVDTGSTDRTVEIAKKFNAGVHFFAWNDDFSAARNEALKYATGDWVLSLDADEELLPEHRRTILKEMQSAGVMGYRLPIIDEGLEQEGCSHVPRLFRNAPGLFFVGRVHEQIFSSLEARAKEWGLENRLGHAALLHHGYRKEVVDSRGKAARNLRLLQLAVEELPGEPNLVMNLGLELIRSGQLEAGLEQYREALRLMSVLPSRQVVPELRETLLTQLTTHLLGARRFSEIVELWRQPFPQSSGLTASQHFMLGLALMELKQPAAAAEQMRQCLAKRRQPALSPINKEILKAGPHHCLALSLAALGQQAGAEEAFRDALGEDAKSRPVRFDFAKFQSQQGRPLQALKLANELVAESGQDIQAWLLGGQIALSQPEFLEFAQDWTGEAIKHFPEDSAILLQRAEALTLNQQAALALPLWTRAHFPNSARHLAALTLCEVLAGECRRHFTPHTEKLVSQEFLKWYRHLIKCKAHSLINQINEKLDDLQAILPTAVGVLGAAMKQAEAAMAV
jgi:glycosyltransferase involved in cell wall biosynthesis/Tfp pilus assembly protein PilF